MDTGRGIEGGGSGHCNFSHTEMPCIIALLRSTHFWRTLWILSHVEFIFDIWTTCVVYYDRWPHPLGNSDEVQAPCFDRIFPTGSYCDAILVAHMCRYLGEFFVASRRASQSNR